MHDQNKTGHFQYDDRQFEEQFRNLKLNPELFDHEAHLRLAWIHITTYGIEKALDTISSQLKAYVVHVGAADKYNKTATMAAIKAVYHFILKSTSSTFQDFMIAFPRLKDNFIELMGYHYSYDIFNSEKAKKNYLEPDLLPFD